MVRLNLENIADYQVINKKIRNLFSPSLVYTSNNDANEMVLAQAQLMLKRGVHSWRIGNYGRAMQLLTKSIELLIKTNDIATLAHCYVSLALVKIRLGKIEEAIVAYQIALNLQPEKFLFWNNLGLLYLQLHDLDVAISMFSRAVQNNNKDVISWTGLGDSFYKKGRINEALFAYKNARSLLKSIDLENTMGISPELAKRLLYLLFQLAMLFTKKSQYKEAIEAYQNILEYDTVNAEVWNEIGRLHIKLSAFESAVNDFENAVRINPNFGEAYLNLAYVYIKLNKGEKSIPLLIKCIEMLSNQHDRKYASDLLEAIQTALQNKDWNSKIGENNDSSAKGITSKENKFINYTFYEKKTSHNPYNKTWIKKDFCKSRRKLFLERITYHQRIKKERDIRMKDCFLFQSTKTAIVPSSSQAEVDPGETALFNNPHLWNELGNAYFIDKKYDEAITSYKKAIEVQPSFGISYNNIALIKTVQGEYFQALQYFKRAIDFMQNEYELAIVWNGLGNVYRCLREYKNARVAYKKAAYHAKNYEDICKSLNKKEIEDKQYDSYFWFDLGRLFYSKLAYEKATESFRKAIELKPTFLEPYQYLARVFAFQGKQNDAINLYKKCVELALTDNEKALIWNWIGDIYRKQNNYEKALAAYQNSENLAKDKNSLVRRVRLSMLGNCVISK